MNRLNNIITRAHEGAAVRIPSLDADKMNQETLSDTQSQTTAVLRNFL